MAGQLEYDTCSGIGQINTGTIKGTPAAMAAGFIGAYAVALPEQYLQRQINRFIVEVTVGYG